MHATILKPAAFRHYIDRFNLEDPGAEESKKLALPNEAAWGFLEQNIPWFGCPDKTVEELYYYRWWSFRKHLTNTPAGWVITEFLPPVPWAGIYNTISCAAGHHLYEARWLHDQKYANDYAHFWMLPEAEPRKYSYWAADAVRAVTLATGDPTIGRELLPNLVANFHAWERKRRDANGLFWQNDGEDGMEFSLGASGNRPSINSYMYGDAMAIADMARRSGDSHLAAEFDAEASKIKGLVQGQLWNPHDEFFETVHAGKGLTGIREQIGFTPWYFNLPDPGHEGAWNSLLDPQGFAATFGPTTVERRATGFMHPEAHDCLWNGPSWPYATTQTLVAMANLLDNYHQNVVGKADYFNQFLAHTKSQSKDGRPWIAEDLDADTGKWIVDLPRSIDYNHSGYADLVISGLAGLRPRADNQIVLKPLLPADSWPWFCLDAVPYHGHSLTILWDKAGTHYNQGKGLSLFLDGKRVSERSDLGALSAHLPARRSVLSGTPWVKHEGPVLGGDLGTCFDLCVLEESGKYRMYFSWRPKKSIAVSESSDGVHWSTPQIVLGPSGTGWEDDINRPGVVKVGDGYHMWYTGQFNGHSSIGYATSTDGLHWQRRPKPVMEPDQAWEKVAVMCPTVQWDKAKREFRMWYSGGDQYEPDAIGYATSTNGIQWHKHEGPVFQADPQNRWEQFKVTACQVLPVDGWQVMFYIGFRDIDHAQIGIARSRDGISNWERLKSNPIVSPTVDGWDADASYKPYALFDEFKHQWLLWYNGRQGGFEQIGLVTKEGRSLGF